MRILVVLTESPYQDQTLCFAEQAIGETDGTQTLLAVAPSAEDAVVLRHTLSASLSPGQQAALQIRHGDFYQQVLAEMRKGGYDLTLVGADSPLEAEPQYTSPAARLARLSEMPLGIVRACPQQWDRALICARGLAWGLPTIRTGQELAGQLGVEPAILHVTTSGGLQDTAGRGEEFGGIRVRSGTVMEGIQAEIAAGGYKLLIVGPHSPLAGGMEPGPTLAEPDFTHQITQLGLPVVIIIGRPPALAARDKQPAVVARPKDIGRIIRYAVLELLIYVVLVMGFAAASYRFLVKPLDTFFRSNLTLYAVIALLLMVGQGMLLEALTAFLLDRLRLERFD